MKKIYVLVLFCCLSASLLLAASPAAGTWECQGQAQRQSQKQNRGPREFSFTLTITEQDGTLTGSMSTGQGKRPLKDIKFEEGVLTARVGRPQLGMTFRAEFDGDNITGSISGQRSTTVFSGTRQ